MGVLSSDVVDRAASRLTDWMFLASGLVLLALTLVTPAWLTCRNLSARRDLMALQLQRMTQQRDRYEAFYHALEDRDPVLLKRLAFTQLGYKSVNKQLLDIHGAGDSVSASSNFDARSASVDRWLLEPMPAKGVSVAQAEPVNSRLVRLTSHWISRTVLLAVAFACMFGGLWPRTDKDSEKSGAGVSPACVDADKGGRDARPTHFFQVPFHDRAGW